MSIPNAAFWLLERVASSLPLPKIMLPHVEFAVCLDVYGFRVDFVLHLLAYESSKRFTHDAFSGNYLRPLAPPRDKSLKIQVFRTTLRLVILLGFGFDGTFHSQDDDWYFCAFTFNAHSLKILHNGLGHGNKIPFRLHLG